MGPALQSQKAPGPVNQGRLRLEDERWWAIVFGTISAVVVLVLQSVEGGPVLLALSLPLLGLWGVRAAWSGLGPWWLAIAAAATFTASVWQEGDAEGNAFLIIVAIFYVSFREARLWALVVAMTCSVLAPSIAAAAELTDDGDGWLYWTMGIAICFWFGRVAFQLRVVVHELNRTRAQMAEQAITTERQRIARDVHDLVGHSLSVMMLHVTGARRALRADPSEAEAALKAAEEVGRSSMGEIRRTIGLLQDTPESAPAQSVSDIDDLVEQYRSAGVEVSYSRAGENNAGAEVARGITAYRIVQEALVNATKHAPSSGIEVTIVCDDEWTIEVVNHAVGDPSGLPASSPGFGLIGMTERARSLGGTLEAGPSAGRWIVRATLPSATALARS